MPRKRKTQPGPGGAYANRTDLTQPVSAPSGLPYGERQELETAQQQAPLPQQASLDQILAAAMQHSFQPTMLNAETSRPNEPIQHGLPTGPGGGPEVMGAPPRTSDMLQQLADQTSNTFLLTMAQRARQYGA